MSLIYFHYMLFIDQLGVIRVLAFHIFNGYCVIFQYAVLIDDKFFMCEEIIALMNVLVGFSMSDVAFLWK